MMIGWWENTDPSMGSDLIRSFFAVFDSIAVGLLRSIYEVFFLVANATIVSGDVIKVFYSRIQLILGILMIFKLAMAILNIIINPDTVKDQKQGPGKMVIRIVVALFMLTLVIPINIPNATNKSLNAYINDHGILFGFLYKAQDSILSENILAKLILGISTTDSTATANGMNINNLSDVGNTMASIVLKVFVRINVFDDTAPACDSTLEDDKCGNTVCPAAVNASHYAEENVDPQVILFHLNDACGGIKRLSPDQERYAFAYTPIIGAIAMLIMTIVITGFTVDIAVRALKLAVLRLVAPVPIITYINPPKQGGGAFDNWTKSLISTYVDLFVRLAIVYFGLFMLQIVMSGGMDIFGSNVQGFTFTSGVAFVFVILGILVFIRQAPQFIKDILGIKGKPMGNVGLSSMMAGTASLIGGAGLAGAGAAAIGTFGAASEAAAQGKPAPHGWAAGRDLAAQLRTGDPKARGGIVNNLQDRLSRSANIRMARRYGVTAAGLDVAKEISQNADAEAARAKDLYERFTQGNMSDYERAQYASREGLALTGSRDQQDEIIRNHMYNKMNDTASAAFKAKKKWDEGKEYAKTHRVNPSFEEEHRPSLFGERPMTNTAEGRRDMYNARGRGRTAHQTVADRIWGSHDKWDDPTSERTENRWNPGTPKDVDNDTYHDNPFAPQGAGSPSQGHGPGGGLGPGGGPGPGGPRP